MAAGNPWCNPGTLALGGLVDWNDPNQDFVGNPDAWTTGLVANHLHITNTESGTAFSMDAADSVIMNSTIDTAGDHVHAGSPGTFTCAQTDPDNEEADWSDGITFVGPANTIQGNTVINPSDVGIVFFGGHQTIIRDNFVETTSGNHGAFAGIGIHPWILGDVGYGQVTGNTVTNTGDTRCGGMHVGIDIGPHMWEGGCSNGNSVAVGNPAPCVAEPPPPAGTICPAGGDCQKWAYVPAGSYFWLTDNSVTGAQINYLMEGVDLQGTFVSTGNTSHAPRLSDWQETAPECGGSVWGTFDFVAHHPSWPGWTDLRIHCER